MANYDSVLSQTIDDLNELGVITGKEKMLIQNPSSDETQSITVDLLLSGLVNLLRNSGVIEVSVKDPTVPSYIRDITEEDLENWRNDVEEVKKLRDDISRLQSSTIKVTNFSVTPNIVEIGSVINSITLKWDTNFRVLTRQYLNDVEIPDITKRSRTLDGPFTSSQTYTLRVEGDDGNSDIKTTELKFLNNIYYGTEKLHDINSSFINSLSRVLTENKQKGFTVVSREQEYIYIALPVRFGAPKFTIISEEADFELITKFDHENSSGYVEEYAVYRTTNVHLGQTTIRLE
jgi:hypothetical protein|uniref:Uncharacterized protein n=1 Tax=Myoviridae sp. ctcyQ27 TaxID=2825139 RepID=A0A8S5UFG0_9CAUD|nr:MAG TPA: hypothetical protein [Myoviridae sp. ctcyQ27]